MPREISAKQRFDDVPVREYYLRTELRRAVVWAMLGMVLLAALSLYLRVRANKPLWDFNSVSGTIMFGAFALMLCQFLGPRLRIDQYGIWIRRLRKWECWSWDEFADGKIRIGMRPLTYESPEHPLFTHRLNLGAFEESDAQEIDSLVRSIWMPAPSAIVPERLTVRVEWPNKATLTLSPEGITVAKKDRQSSYLWKELIGIDIWRSDARATFFRKMTIALPDQKVMVRTSRSEAEMLLGYIHSAPNIAPTKVRDYALHGEPKTVDEWEARRSLAAAHWNEMRRMQKIVCWVLGFTFVLIPFMFKWPIWVFQMGLWGLQFVAIMWLGHTKVVEAEKKVKQLDEYRRLFVPLAVAPDHE